MDGLNDLIIIDAQDNAVLEVMLDFVDAARVEGFLHVPGPLGLGNYFVRKMISLQGIGKELRT